MPRMPIALRACFGVALCLAACTAKAEWLAQTRSMMGTEIRVELWAENAERGSAAQQAVFDEVHRLDLMMNPMNPDSELSRINREAAQEPVVTTPEIVEVVQRALYYSDLSGGAFDITFASAGRLYDYRGHVKPSADALVQAAEKIDYHHLRLDPEAGSIAFDQPGMAIDLGGIAKGYAVDRGIAILRAAGITSAVVAAGGDSRVLGNLGDRPRVIGIRHPRKDGEYAALIPLQDTAISTSGDYERYFEEDGVRYHHIINPRTGGSAGGVQSASVIAPHGIDSDAMSTTVFVLGVEKGLAFINARPGVEAIIVDSEGRLHYSDGLLQE
ncbi:FAD:protein FMN transferase [Mangrovimicrobium sediminis]|nr:FAD:protein FMN transferase [Haliea sp. SAOS-164]